MLFLPPSSRVELSRFAVRGYPHETCGVLIGRTEGSAQRVERVVQARNGETERAHDRYELDPGDLVAADSEARAASLSIVGIWHSHPDRAAEPSELDRSAAWSGWSYLIVSVTREGVQSMRSWRLERERFAEEVVTS